MFKSMEKIEENDFGKIKTKKGNICKSDRRFGGGLLFAWKQESYAMLANTIFKAFN